MSAEGLYIENIEGIGVKEISPLGFGVGTVAFCNGCWRGWINFTVQRYTNRFH